MGVPSRPRTRLATCFLEGSLTSERIWPSLGLQGDEEDDAFRSTTPMPREIAPSPTFLYRQ